MTSSEVVRLLNAPGVDTPLGLRDRALLEVLYATGARASEAVGLSPEGVDLKVGYARVFGKGRKERIVPLGRPAIAAVEAYLEDGRPRLVATRDCGRLFVTRTGRPLGRERLWRIVRDFARIAGGKVPDDRVIDGVDQTDFLLGKQEKSNREGLIVYMGNDVWGVKWRNWKLHLKEQDNTLSGTVDYGLPRVYNLYKDPGKTQNVIFPET